MTQKLITADKDPNFLNRLEQRANVVRPIDTLDHIVRVQQITTAPSNAPVILDPVTGRNINEPNPFKHPKALEKEPGYRPRNGARPKHLDPATGQPKKVFMTKTTKSGKEVKIQVESPYFYNAVTGEREYEDLRPVGVRIASDAQGNPLTFATRPGEKVHSLRKPARTVMADMQDFDDDDPAAVFEQSMLRTRK